MVDQDLQRQYEDYFDLFSRPGWTLLMEDIEEMAKSIDSLEYITTLEDLHFKRGQLIILKRIAGFKASIEAAYEQLEEQGNL